MSHLVPSGEDRFSDHGADSVQIGVESNRLPLHGLGVGVVHGVLEGSLAVVVFVNGAPGVLSFWCGSIKTNQTNGMFLLFYSGEKSV